MTGIFHAPEWDIDALSEMLNRKIFGHDSRKLSKLKKKRNKKGISSKSMPAVCVSQKSNKILPHSVQEQFQTSRVSPANTKGKSKHKTVRHSTLGLKGNKLGVRNEEFNGTEQQSRKKKKKKHKGDENVSGQFSSSHRKETVKQKQLQLPPDFAETCKKQFPSDARHGILDSNTSMSKNKSKQNSNPLQDSLQFIRESAGKVSLKTKHLNPLKRKIHDVSAGAGSDELPAKKLTTGNSEVYESRSIVKKQRNLKRKFKQSLVEPVNSEANKKVNDKGSAQKKKGKVNEAFSPDSEVLREMLYSVGEEPKQLNAKRSQKNKTSKCRATNEAFGAEPSARDDTMSGDQHLPKKAKVKKFLQNQNPKGIVNEAFSAESSLQDESLGSDHQVPKKLKNKGHRRKPEGIVNEAFSADSSVQDDSCSRKHQVPKKREMKGPLQKQKSKGIVNEAFQDDPSSVEDGNITEPRVPVQAGTPPWHILDNLRGGQPLAGKKLSGASLRERMIAKLKASRFRYLNEQIYSSESGEIHKYFSNDRNSFLAYHEGFRHQVSQWPMNPLDRIINALKKKPKNLVIADFGCGDARLARSLPNTVHSFDVAALCEEVTVCDMSHTPLKKGSVDVVVFCLSLMGTNLADYLLEANRVLKVGGQLKIAEVQSRFEDVNTFLHTLKKFGFTNTTKDFSHKVFYFLDFKKESKPVKRDARPSVTLRPCLYKKR